VRPFSLRKPSFVHVSLTADSRCQAPFHYAREPLTVYSVTARTPIKVNALCVPCQLQDIRYHRSLDCCEATAVSYWPRQMSVPAANTPRDYATRPGVRAFSSNSRPAAGLGSYNVGHVQATMTFLRIVRGTNQ
jgi:hypothetical protein